MVVKENGRINYAKASLRKTKQRDLILSIIKQGHFDADEIYVLARKVNPRISLSTVYRTLQKLKQLGVIDEHHFDETHHHYELKGDDEHYHLVCLDCGKITEFQHPMERYINEKILAASNFKITSMELEVSGYCEDCRKKRNI